MHTTHWASYLLHSATETSYTKSYSKVSQAGKNSEEMTFQGWCAKSIPGHRGLSTPRHRSGDKLPKCLPCPGLRSPGGRRHQSDLMPLFKTNCQRTSVKMVLFYLYALSCLFCSQSTEGYDNITNMTTLVFSAHMTSGF